MRTSRKSPFFHWFVVPAVVLAVVFVSAMAALFQYSFREYIPGSIAVGGFTFGNFARMAKWLYVRVFVDSLNYAALTAVFNLLLGYPLAYALVRSRSAILKSLIMIVTISPLFTGDIVRTYAWLIVLGKNGFINSVLRDLGLITQPLELLYTPAGVVIALVQYSMPVMVIILAAAISHIDVDYERAAASLGASPVKVFFKVTLPLSAPGIVSGLITIFAWTLSAFATPQLVGGGKVNMISNMVYNMGFSNFDFPFAAVLSMTALLLTMALLALIRFSAQRFERIGLH
ncbi:MAG TPA: ABC transporter permease [Alphaproteobacteria bacterium]|nr:ABC transporter permease [Alphaproteobacteria bacterium]